MNSESFPQSAEVLDLLSYGNWPTSMYKKNSQTQQALLEKARAEKALKSLKKLEVQTNEKMRLQQVVQKDKQYRNQIESELERTRSVMRSHILEKRQELTDRILSGIITPEKAKKQMLQKQIEKREIELYKELAIAREQYLVERKRCIKHAVASPQIKALGSARTLEQIEKQEDMKANYDRERLIRIQQEKLEEKFSLKAEIALCKLKKDRFIAEKSQNSSQVVYGPL